MLSSLFSLLLLLTTVPRAAQLPKRSIEQPCNLSLWKHVYNSARLQVKFQCVEVTGVKQDATRGRSADGCRHEADGDLHCWLKLDAGEERYLAKNNLTKQGGNLVYEPMCQHTVTQKDAVSACANWSQQFATVPVGAHIKVIGAFVFDSEHKHNEVHPVSSIEILPP